MRIKFIFANKFAFDVEIEIQVNITDEHYKFFFKWTSEIKGTQV